MKTLPAPDAIRGEQLVANAAFFLLFPGFFYYHTVLGIGAVGAFLGGYFAPISLLVVGPLTWLYLVRIRRDPNRLAKVDVAYLLFMGYFATVVAVQAILGRSMLAATHHVLNILFMLNIFFLFKAIDFAAPLFRRTMLASLLAMSAIVFAYSTNGVFYLGALGIAKDADSLATYQGFSRSYLITIVPLIAYTPSRLMRVLLYSLATPTLFVNTARSEFVALLFLIPVVEFYHTKHKLAMAMLFVGILALLKMNLDTLLVLLPDNRILELLDLSQSTSANSRAHLTVNAWKTIADHPLLGDFASYAPGYYAHNVLSAWVDLGLFGIVFVLAIVIGPALPIFFDDYFTVRDGGDFILGFSLACITVLLLLTSHFFTDMLIGATLGSYSTYWYGRKYDKHRALDVGASTPRYADLR